MLTGKMPSEHGAVGNGWRDPRTYEVALWRQSNHLVRGEKLYEAAARMDPSFTCAKLFWWWNMGAAVTWSLTPRPYYPADGRKVMATYSAPQSFGAAIEAELGPFPFFQFWGPNAGLASSEWIAEAARAVDRWHSPTLLLVYLPHLDYDLQRYGASDPRTRENVRAIDAIVGRLLAHCRERGRRVIVLSEYGLTDVHRPVHINRVLRQAGYLAVRDELGTDAFDPGASRAFAVADHQVAHVYVRNPRDVPAVTTLLQQTEGIDAVLDRPAQAAVGLDHDRSGELVAVSTADAWFTYYYWLDDGRAPDYARTVDIHRKPGYDPAELILDPALALPKLRIAATLARKKLGFRYLLRVIPLDASLVRGSHGRLPAAPDEGPVFMSTERGAVEGVIEPTAVRDRILAHLFDPIV
jgi:predicted AlkP superfamily pyrophosphatase or phosphodiesterase